MTSVTAPSTVTVCSPATRSRSPLIVASPFTLPAPSVTTATARSRESTTFPPPAMRHISNLSVNSGPTICVALMSVFSKDLRTAVHLRVWDLSAGWRKTFCHHHQIARLLQLDHEAPATDRVRHAAVHEDEVARRDWDTVEHLQKSILRLERGYPLLARDVRLEAEVDTGVRRRARQEIPALRLADWRVEKPFRARHRGMRLDDEPLVAVEQLHENR